jgi:hypothetical protein
MYHSVSTNCAATCSLERSRNSNLAIQKEHLEQVLLRRRIRVKIYREESSREIFMNTMIWLGAGKCQEDRKEQATEIIEMMGKEKKLKASSM